MTTTDLELSIVLVVDRAASVRDVLRIHLDAVDPGRAEMIVVALPGTVLNAETLGAEVFDRIRVVPCDTRELGRAEAQGVRAARAPIVVFAQAHVLPLPGFVAAILDAWETNSAVVGPSVRSANPASHASWVTMLLHYPHGRPPGHASAYDRRRLLALGDRLEAHLDAGFALQEALSDSDGRLGIAPGACVEIVVIPHFGWFLVDHFTQSAKFAADRARAWRWPRRLLYALGFPLIPAVRLARVVAELHRRGHLRELPVRLPTLLAGFTASALGEAMGYAAGNRTERRRADMALHRLDYVRPRDRR